MTDNSATAAPSGTELPADRLRWRCDPGTFDFVTSADLADPGEPIGQPRAIEAIGFAIDMDRPNYNLFVHGPEGFGKHGIVTAMLERHAAGRPVPPDLCYINNFDDERAPIAVQLTAGHGRRLKTDVDAFVRDLGNVLRSAFEGEQYRNRRQTVEDELKERQEQVLKALDRDARAAGLALMHTPMGFVFAPMRNGEVIKPEVFERLTEEEKERVQDAIRQFQERLQRDLRQVPVWMKETQERLRELNRETAGFAVAPMIGELRAAYGDVEEVSSFLDAVERDIALNVEAILQQPQGGGEAMLPAGQDGHPVTRRYRVNLLVDNGDCAAPPVLFEDSPGFDQLLGRIEHQARFGTLHTDFLLVRPGALHRANGGYLILDVRQVLTRPMAWDGLKRALTARQLRIRPLADELGMLATSSLEPEPVPLDVKVVLIGDPRLYAMLSALDPEFPRLFKVAAEFDDRIERNEDALASYVRMLAAIARREGLKPLDRGGMALVLEEAVRHAGDSERLTLHHEALADLLREADYWAGRRKDEAVTADAVTRALDARRRRGERIRERMLEQIERGTIRIETEGAATGAINGLAVYQMGEFFFGKPSRITARVRLGRGDVVDIEREVKLGGPTHSKGVLILTGFLSGRFGGRQPLSLNASLVFEQSYGGVDGDSASSTELYALLSAISGIPIRQSWAVTGSVDQYGNVQAIGGVNEKVEGFFDVCNARGLTGDQGVLIPASNVKHLMLHPRVVDAVREGRFHIHAVEHVDQGIELLTGTAAGQADDKGVYPEGTVNRAVQDRLKEFNDIRKALARSAEEAEGERDGE
ncbi:Lon protease family protein [Minwuia thermotolerans]|uniref:endopeptidase La n=1 Tax=Minwuia thermotolerans TaxID=2056226 RepID=A0A2M9FVE8_9PROT|nr:ATP-binding protein [Minwuia thermotolerans]PJK27448.1 ATP-dependent protease [Minwuia thermotolerans]